MMGRERNGLLACLFALLCAFALPQPQAEATGRVEAVAAHVTASEGLPPLVQQRMERSVQVIAEQLLLGMSADSSDADAAAQSEVIRQVFDKVLVGYTVRGVSLRLGDTADVTVELMPWSDQIRTISVETSVEGMPPEVERLVRQDLADVGSVFSDALYGLPVAAADLSMRSDTIPNLTLLNHRELMQEQVDMLVGVPVAFVARHQHDFEQLFAERLDAQRDFQALRMKTVVTIAPQERMAVMSRSDSSRYRARLTGWVDMGRKESKYEREMDSLRFRLHAGRMVTARDELFTQLDFMPQKVDWGWEMGYSHRIGMGTTPMLRYDMREKRFVLGAMQALAPRWQLRYEYRFTDHLGEAGLLYQIHDFLGVEYVLDKTQGWLRLIGNF